MAISNQVECNHVVGCMSKQPSSEMIPQTTSRPKAFHGISDIGAIIRAVLDRIIKSYAWYQSRIALTRLNDDQLRDIGLERHRDGFVTRANESKHNTY